MKANTKYMVTTSSRERGIVQIGSVLTDTLYESDKGARMSSQVGQVSNDIVLRIYFAGGEGS